MPQGEQTAEPVQQVNQIEQGQATQTEPDYKKLYEETSGKYKELEGKYSETNSAIENFERYFNTDELAAERARAYLQAQREGKDVKELWKAMEKSKVEPKAEKAPVVDIESIKKDLLQQIQPTLESVTQATRAQAEQAATLAQERDKAQLFKDEPWMTEELYKEYETRFGKQINDMVGRIMANQGPFLTQAQKNQAYQQAENQALSMYSHLSERQLLGLFMDDHRTKFIAEGRRAAPKLPEGMKDNLPTGKAPQLLDQLKRVYKDAQGDPRKLEKLITEFAPQLGLSEEKTYALVASE